MRSARPEASPGPKRAAPAGSPVATLPRDLARHRHLQRAGRNQHDRQQAEQGCKRAVVLAAEDASGGEQEDVVRDDRRSAATASSAPLRAPLGTVRLAGGPAGRSEPRSVRRIGPILANGAGLGSGGASGTRRLTAPLSLSDQVSEISYPLRRDSSHEWIDVLLAGAPCCRSHRFQGQVRRRRSRLLWSIAKPLAYFGVLWLVFAHLLRTANQTEDFTIFLLIGILLYTFFVDTVSTMLPSIVTGGSILRRLAFPPILIPLSASVGIGITFFANMSALAVFIAIQKVAPRAEWLLVPPLLAELCIFCVGVGLLVAALYVRFRDVVQIWELTAQLLFFASAIFYPIGILPVWAQKVAFLNPFVQVMQDVRHAILGGPSGPNDVTAATVYGSAWGRLIPVLIAVLVFLGALAFFRREGRFFAERV